MDIILDGADFAELKGSVLESLSRAKCELEEPLSEPPGAGIGLDGLESPGTEDPCLCTGAFAVSTAEVVVSGLGSLIRFTTSGLGMLWENFNQTGLNVHK